MSYFYEVKEQPVQATLAIRTRTPVENLSKVLGQGYGAIAEHLGQLGEQPAGPPFAIYYNMDMADLDIELGFPVARELPGQAEVKASQLPTGRAATCLYTGSYERMAEAYEAMGEWMKAGGYEPTGLVYEFYLNDPTSTPPEELQTQIVFPLK